VRFQPPLTITWEQLERALTVFADGLRTVSRS
jgi:4-aminobutyrate aminotransferase-like enzyme